MNRSFRIGDRMVGTDQPCYIVAEMSGNHGQSYDRALAIVRAAAGAGADAVKMQAYTADTITLQHDSQDFRIQKGNSWESFNTLYELYKEAYTPWEWFAPLAAEAKALGMDAFCSVFDHSSVDYMESIGTNAYKIAAPEITDIPLLRKTARTGKPVILSSGVSTKEDLALATDTLRKAGCEQIMVLKCTSEYPAPINQANLQTIQDISQRFNCLAGLSDHTLDSTVAIAAVCVGACMVEKHLTLDSTETVDSFFSLQPEEFKSLVEKIRVAEQALGKVDYSRVGLKSGTADGRRSLYASKSIRSGEIFSSDNIRSVRPAHGLHPIHWDDLIGATATRDIGFGERLTEADLPTMTDQETDKIESTILQLYIKAGLVAAEEQNSAYRLLDDDSLDSFAKIGLIMELEAEFEISMSPTDLMRDSYRSVSGMAKLVVEQKNNELRQVS
ncbi:pseudaminic acid synthase [bacterium]|nr:pseudaminic acid synthase [bacterium]